MHDGRHYKKLIPVVAHHQAVLDAFLDRYWAFYDELLTYKTHPTPRRSRPVEPRLRLEGSTVVNVPGERRRMANHSTSRRQIR